MKRIQITYLISNMGVVEANEQAFPLDGMPFEAGKTLKELLGVLRSNGGLPTGDGGFVPASAIIEIREVE